MRKAKKSDFEATYRIKTNSIKSYVEKIWGWKESYQREIHRVNFNDSDIEIIEYNHKEVGYLALKETKDEIFVDNLLIEEEFQNLGIGKKVIQRIIERATREKKPIRLQVFKINIKAQRFYEKMGFEKTSESEEHIAMSKKWFS